ncbi:MAG: response regulator transcription factor [Chloroflexi bacterium]|jgi:two-component system response regulator NreC|uniref:Response regulator transcription factor n=1 Tax=Candidatus Chlorohelix allophototropha TaxID=3003348 RepID=A0A8T7LWJ5_9CHLR|nr:response regulator transcription factor [Chloroflexota bacterium]WJW65705.1 response regulator transcription factor [Chloroflexota bacterium L227-S17]
MPDKIRVLLADDHAVLRSGLRALLNAEPDIEVIGEAGNGEEAVKLTYELKPDVLVLDLNMPGLGGLGALKKIRGTNSPSKVLVLTMYSEERYLYQVLQQGGSGYVLKSSADTDLLEAIRTVQTGNVYLYPAATKLLLRGYLSRRDEEEKTAVLSDREEEVLRLTAEGYTSQEIGEKLVISSKTVDTYRSRIMEKLGLHHRSELVRYALKHGLLEPSFEE